MPKDPSQQSTVKAVNVKAIYVSTYPYNDLFRDICRQQVELVLRDSIKSNHQHEVSNLKLI